MSTISEDEHAKQLERSAWEARSAHLHKFEAIPWQEALRGLTEQTITAITAARVEGECDEADLSPVLATLGGISGPNYVLLWGDGGPSTVMVSDEMAVWDAWIVLATAMRAHYVGGRNHREECICDPRG